MFPSPEGSGVYWMRKWQELVCFHAYLQIACTSQFIKENSQKYKGNFHLFNFHFFGMKMTSLINSKPVAEKLRSWRFSRHPYHHMLLMSYVICHRWHMTYMSNYVIFQRWHTTYDINNIYANMGVYRTVKTSAIHPLALK